MKKFRILEQKNFIGETCFIPQYRKFFIWFSFYDFDSLPKLIKFYSFSSAKEFINVQNLSGKPKIHYLI